MLWKLCGSQHTFESALEAPVIHISVEIHNVLDCELGDSFCVMEPLWKSTEYESASKHPVIHIFVEFHNGYGPVMEVNTNMNHGVPRG